MTIRFYLAYNIRMHYFKNDVLKLIGILLNQNQINALMQYATELVEWNQKFNLTAITDFQDIYTKHFLDSLSCYTVIKPDENTTIVDVGSGAGFPGLPLKIVAPQIHLTIIESNRKKAEFCAFIASKLNLTNIQILNQRVESVGQDLNYRECFEWGVSRAVAHLSTLVEYILPLVKINGKALAMKAKNAMEEMEIAKNAISLLGGNEEKVIPVNIPRIMESRYLIQINKEKTTPQKYPRRIGVPLKKPLS